MMALQCPEGLRGIWDLGETLFGRCWGEASEGQREIWELGAGQGVRKPVGTPATELPGDPGLLPQSPQEPPQSSLHLPGAGEETQVLPRIQWHKNKEADGTAPSACPPTGSLGLSATPPSLAQVPSQSTDHVIPGRGGTGELSPLPPSLHMTSLSPPPPPCPMPQLLFPLILSLCFSVYPLPAKILSEWPLRKIPGCSRSPGNL